MNEEAHWNQVAASYEDAVLNVFRSERGGTLRRYFKKLGDKNKNAIDFGCGIGNAFDYLSTHFKNVLAIDISEECLRQARLRNAPNITFKKANLASKNLMLPSADFILCANVAILPDLGKNKRIIGNAAKVLRKGGSAIFVIPSMDSILFSAWRLIEWYKLEGIPARQIPPSEYSAFKGSKVAILQGIIDVGGVPTKHYSRSEIEVLFPEMGFKVRGMDKLEYDWITEFNEPPKWMKAPYPWDWLVECGK